MNTYQQIIDRAIQLEYSMSHGNAIKIACAEFGQNFWEIGEIISCLVNNQVNNPIAQSKYNHTFLERNRMQNDRMIPRHKKDTVDLQTETITINFKKRLTVVMPLQNWLEIYNKAKNIPKGGYPDDVLCIARQMAKKAH